MRKKTLLITALSVMLGACSVNAAEINLEGYTLQELYKLQEEVWNKIQQLEDEKENGTFSEIAITTENWQDYFEAGHRTVELEMNPFGQVQELRVYWGIWLKEEYMNRFVENEQNEVFVKMKWDSQSRVVDVNMETGDYQLGESIGEPYSFEEVLQFSQSNYNGEHQYFATSSGCMGGYILDNGVAFHPKSDDPFNGAPTINTVNEFEIIDITGSIYLYD